MAEVRLPGLSVFEEDPVLTRWHVAVGDHVAEGQGIASVELDKAEAIVVAPHAGRVVRLLAEVGDHLMAGDPIAEIS